MTCTQKKIRTFFGSCILVLGAQKPLVIHDFDESAIIVTKIHSENKLYTVLGHNSFLIK